MALRRRARRAPRERVNPPAEALYAHKWRIFGVMMIGWAMSMLDVSIVNITIPTLQRDLSASLDTVSWVVNAYNIVFAVLLVAMGKLADQFGRRRLFVIGLTIFTIGSGLCALSWSVGALIGFRVVQGVGAGILAPLGFAMTALVFPPAQRGRGLATIAVVALLANAAGPVLGGVLLQIGDWHWIFLVNVPFGIIGVGAALRWWPETFDLTADRSIDWLGIGLLAGAVSTLAYALVETNARGWGDASVLFFLQIAIVLAIAFVLSQRYGKRPMITRALAGNRQFASANVAMLLVGAGAVGALFLLSLVFINLWGFTPLEAGLAIAPVPACGLLTWPLVGRAADNAPPYRLAIPALLALVVGLLWFSFLPATSEGAGDYLRVLPGLLLMGVGMGTVFPSVNVGAMGAVAGPELGLASGVLNTARQLGTAIGIALLIAVFAGTGSLALGSVRDRVEDRAYDAGVSAATWRGLIGRDMGDFAGGSTARLPVGQGFDRYVRRQTAGAARDAFGWAFRAAALALLLAVPFARRMTRTPAMARAEAAAAAPPKAASPLPVPAAAAAAAATPAAVAAIGSVAAPSSVEARIDELEATLRELRERLSEGERT
jgi:EmrB/QacA subfamily drug resistance transporter